MQNCLIMDIGGTALSAADKALLARPEVAGVILFSRNFQDIEQLMHLTTEIKNVRASPLLITVDHEGGLVQRFQQGFTRLPALANIGKFYVTNKSLAYQLARDAGFVLAAELIAVGVDLSYAPVLDIDRQLNSVIGNRSFHPDPQVITELASAMIEGMREAGMATVGKHFPGHGGVMNDTHLDIATDPRELDEIIAEDMFPFIELIKTNKLTSIMTAHIIYSSVDPVVPCFSAHWLQSILRREFHFQGIIFSDDLTMKGAEQQGSIEKRAVLALEAGCDRILVCNNREAVYAVLEAISALPNNVNAPDGNMLFPTRQYTREELQQMPRWVTAVEKIKHYSCYWTSHGE